MTRQGVLNRSAIVPISAQHLISTYFAIFEGLTKKVESGAECVSRRHVFVKKWGNCWYNEETAKLRQFLNDLFGVSKPCRVSLQVLGLIKRVKIQLFIRPNLVNTPKLTLADKP